MSIPKILAIDINYDISPNELEKTVNLKLNINKEKYFEMNNKRKKEGLLEITLDQVQKLVTKGKVQFEENNFNYNIQPNNDEKEIFSNIEPLLEIELSQFKTRKTEFIHLSPDFNQLMEENNYELIVNKYYHNIRKDKMKKDIGENNFTGIESGEHKFSIVFKTLLNEPLKQVKELFLPTFNSNKDAQFFNETEEWNNNKIYKYISYIPENYLWELPVDMKKGEIKINNINYKVRYLNMDEITNNSFISLLEDENYINNLNKIIIDKTVDLNIDKPFEMNWSNEDFKETNGIVEINEMPQLITNNLDELVLTKPNEIKHKLLRMYFGINNKFFEKKIIKNNIVETTI